jgi:16S rRNA (adenine1518-N6/adenine1519-N6)-dimethyltransferase
MFQQEVAERIVAARDDAYGRLAVAGAVAQRAADRDEGAPLRLRAAAQGDVGGGAHRAGRAAEGVDAATLERLTAAAFGQRRKMLRQSLKGVPGALDALETLGIDAERRAETLSVDEFVALARADA